MEETDPYGSKPKWSERTDARGRLIICTISGVDGAARVFGKGEQDARDRAEQQARTKLAEQNAGG